MNNDISEKVTISIGECMSWKDIGFFLHVAHTFWDLLACCQKMHMVEKA